MDNQDKLFDKIKEASQKAEFQDFPGMEKVWSRVEEKLDKKEDKKTIALWKKIAIAASLLLLISLGYQFLHSDKETVTETPKVVFDAKEIKQFEKPILDKKVATPSSDSEIVSNEEAVKILENQTKNKERVAIQETMIPKAEPIQAVATPKIDAEATIPAKFAISESFDEEDASSSKKDAFEERSYLDRQSAKVAYAAAPAQKAKKNAPLVILNGNAMAHSDDAKRDKMMQAEMSNLQPENVESLVVLDNPLYIIDGIYYSEEDLFGKNPTSPYAPLDKQEIKTITILQAPRSYF
ncbi:hypothetical protein [Flavobacterium sp. MMS24-S5]|uniref:hypothetical protein n=1 Tax=Flavobacterium sp. MMS24-S5 TaxID=3416605 RepID=UPI003D07DDE9